MASCQAIHVKIKWYRTTNGHCHPGLPPQRLSYSTQKETTIKKIGDYGIRGPINNWLNMFLANRKIKVVVERQQSEKVTITSGVA